MRLFLLSLLTISFFSKPCSADSRKIEQQLDIRIPVVDMRDYYLEEKRDEFLETLYNAMTTVGFFAVLNTGVDAEAVKNAYTPST
jgi:hypothetical protein